MPHKVLLVFEKTLFTLKYNNADMPKKLCQKEFTEDSEMFCF